MKSILFVVAVLGFAAFGSAQTQAPTSVSVLADSTQTDDAFIRMKGVSLWIAGVHITADEANTNRATRETELRGNVTMRIDDQK